MLVEALQSRLKTLEDKILRFANLASQTSEKDQQENHWLMAKDCSVRPANCALRSQKLHLTIGARCRTNKFLKVLSARRDQACDSGIFIAQS